MSQPHDPQQYARASLATANNLKTIAEALVVDNLSPLPLKEVEEAVEMVSQMVPAGNVSGIILNGLARLTGQRPAQQTVKRDIGMLFKGVEQVLDKAVYGAMFAGPAAVIWGYQKLLRLAGKSPEDAFPNGTWQFYVDYALREDSARHTNETHGFDTLLTEHHITLPKPDRVSAWVMTAIDVLHRYDDLLENEWRERIYTRLVNDVTGGRFPKLYAQWERQRPYGRRADAGDKPYTLYRRHKFDRFMHDTLHQLTPDELAEWRGRVVAMEAEDLPRYKEQMTLCSYLQPDAYSETHVPLRLRDAYIGLIHNEMYYLIPACRPDSNLPADPMVVRAQVAAILLDRVKGDDADLTRLASVQRSAFAGVVSGLNPAAQQALAALHSAPILINADQRPYGMMLSDIRRGERGAGDHALTIFDTGKTFVFDQSHIYFDGAWGAALAEIMTNEALSWARYLALMPHAAKPQTDGVRPLYFRWTQADSERIQQAPKISVESSAETDQINLRGVVQLRTMFKHRSGLLKLTVNDLLILYRAIHGVTYQPSVGLVADLERLLADPSKRPATQAALDAVRSQENPSILIPVDASIAVPSDRLYPMSFTVPLQELNLIELHHQTMRALKQYQDGHGDRTALYRQFDTLQREYLACLAGFGAVLSRAKEIALAGDSISSGTLRMLAHIPRPLQRLLDSIPSRLDRLNDLIKGREVFSNIGAVVSGSTLQRFITAKDDNEQKTLVWGVITDSKEVMRVSLRDFRPHVKMLHTQGEGALAQRITQDYLSSYAQRFNRYIDDLRHITLAHRETQMTATHPYDE